MSNPSRLSIVGARRSGGFQRGRSEGERSRGQEEGRERGGEGEATRLGEDQSRIMRQHVV